MQVDNPIRQPSWDVGDLFHSDLFSANNNSNNTSHASTSSPSSSSSPGGNHSSISNASSPSSREVSPLPTPPSISLGEQFPEHHHHTAALAASSSSSNLQSPDALYGFYDSASSTSNNNNDARELLGATGPKSPGFMMNAFGAGAGGVGPPASNPYSFPMDDADFNAYMTGLEETYGITTNPAASNAGTSPASSSSSGTSPQQQQHQQQQGQTHTQTQQQQQGMEMMYGFNNMDLEMMSLPMSLDGAFGSMNGEFPLHTPLSFERLLTIMV
ncbi:hypothetical protein BKA70DRAFT_70697 [Coprinopsis sp. MPI-PUGE-AT-0042]|nr:hypothetical protein BKA70DRAFT_70697 [Coprinopsis sp. MPI-PUGE-AT-0042]